MELGGQLGEETLDERVGGGGDEASGGQTRGAAAVESLGVGLGFAQEFPSPGQSVLGTARGKDREGAEGFTGGRRRRGRNGRDGHDPSPMPPEWARTKEPWPPGSSVLGHGSRVTQSGLRQFFQHEQGLASIPTEVVFVPNPSPSPSPLRP